MSANYKGKQVPVGEGKYKSASDGLILRCAESIITQTEQQVLAATQQTLVLAPGAGYVNVFAGALFSLDFGTVATDDVSGNGNLVIRYTNGTGATVAFLEANNFIDATADALAWVMPNDDVAGAANIPIVPVANAALVLDNDGSEFAGSTADSLLKVAVWYYTLPTAL